MTSSHCIASISRSLLVLLALLGLPGIVGAVQSPLLIEGRFLPVDGGLAHQQFGQSLDYDDQRLVVGEPSYLGGTIWIFTRTAGVWAQEGKLQPKAQALVSGGDPGRAVLLRGDDLFVGVPGSYPLGGPAHWNGSVIHYERNGGIWSTAQVIDDASLPQGHFAEFGSALALDGDTLVVGAWGADLFGLFGNSGAVYVFVRDPVLGWVQQAMLWPADGANGHFFGNHVEIEGSTLIVGAPMDSAQFVGPGWVYVYERDDNGTPSDPMDDDWVQQQKLVSPAPAPNNNFGRSLALDGDRLAVGEVAGEGAATDSGTAHVFERSGPGLPWTWKATLASAQGATDDHFGQAVELHGDDLYVGATWEAVSSTIDGSVHHYRRIGGQWTLLGQLFSYENGAVLGEGLAFDGDRLVVGASSAHTFAGGQSHHGAVFSYRAVDATLDAFCGATPALCPCGNSGTAPEVGCLNGENRAGILVGIGPSVGDGSQLEFLASFLRTSTACVLFVGPGQQTALPFSNGLMCVGGGITRLGGRVTDPKLGSAAWGPDVGAGLGWAPGQSLNFQVWYRDLPGVCTGSTPGGSNTTNGVHVTLLP